MISSSSSSQKASCWFTKITMRWTVVVLLLLSSSSGVYGFYAPSLQQTNMKPHHHHHHHLYQGTDKTMSDLLLLGLHPKHASQDEYDEVEYDDGESSSYSILTSNSNKQNQNQNDDENNNINNRRRTILQTSITGIVTTITAAASSSSSSWATVIPSSSSSSSSSYALDTTTTTLSSSSSSFSLPKQQKIPEWTLENGVKMPILALNTVGLSVEDTERAVTLAVQQGITHIDFHPGKERDGVARYLQQNETNGEEGKDKGKRRSELFLNTKIRKAKPGTSPSDAAEQTRQQIQNDLSILQVDSVDMLMLRDSPDCTVIQAQWKVLEDALKAGQTKSIGVINFCQFSLNCLLQTATIKPALNYYMLHIGMGTNPLGLRSYCESNGIRTFAYGAIGEPNPNSELLYNTPIVQQIAKRHHVSTSAVAVRWVLQTGAAVSVRPTIQFGLGTSTCSSDDDTSVPSCQDGIVERASSFTWKLTQQEMNKLNSLTSPNDNPTLFSSTGCPNSFIMPK